MFNFLIGVVFGIVISTVGFSGIAHVADAGVAKVQAVTKEAIKN
jgi:uncharacterized membrane protein YtjA (UPF0391 family)